MRRQRLVSVWKVMAGDAAMTLNASSRNQSGTSRWNRSDMELTNTLLGLRQRSGSPSVSGCRVSRKPRRYLGWPIARSRFAKVSA